MPNRKARGQKRVSPEESEDSELDKILYGDSSDEESSCDEVSESQEEESEDCEPEEEHCVGGYANIDIGQKVGKYEILSKLGWGYFSTVWLTEKPINAKRPSTDASPVYLALKVVKSKKTYSRMAEDEIEIFRRISRVAPRGHSNVVRLVDHFTYKDKNGLHRCLVFPCQGPNLYRLLREEYRDGLPLDVVKRIGRQLLQALEFLHTRCNMIHTDLKPENMLLSYDSIPGNPETWRVILADLGNVDEPKHSQTSYDTVQTRHYRAPEVILKHGFSYPADIWSTGCLFFELATGEVLFEPDSDKEAKQPFKKSEDHMALIITLIGPVPMSFLNRNKNTMNFFFKKNNSLRCGRVQEHVPIHERLVNEFNWDLHDAEPFGKFLTSQLAWIPNKRTTASQLLQHQWLTIQL